MDIVGRIVRLHRSLDAADLPHAFGGALALAWCTRRPRGTVDIDLNVFVEPKDVDSVLAALPAGVATTDADVVRLRRDGQARLWWDGTPVDLFLNTTPFHGRVAERIRTEHFGGTDVPFLACSDLAVFKAFFNRTRDWADLEEMVEAATLDLDLVVGTLTRLLGTGDERVARLISLTSTDQPDGR